MAVKVPQSIGKYRIRRVLGHGGMGVVYEGFDEDIERQVAIKTLHPHLVSEQSADEYLERFRREAKAAAQCTHPNIVAVLEYGRETTPYIVMEYVQGQALDDLLRKNSMLSFKFVLSVVSDILKGLHHAHRNSIVHRDIKPANIMVLNNGHAKLTDFGVARLMSSTEMTRIGLVLGTPDYMSPEQARGISADPRADLYSMALILFEMMTRVRLPEEITLAPLPRIDALPASQKIDFRKPIAASFIPLIQKAISVNPEFRQESARELILDIKGAIAKLRSPDSLRFLTSQEEATQIREVAQPAEQAADKAVESSGQTTRSSSGKTSLGLELNALSGLDESILLELKEQLASLIEGDINAIIEQKGRESISFAEFIYALAELITAKRQRKKFLSSWDID